jgi:hypothetical protein
VAIRHNGFTFRCDIYHHHDETVSIDAETERTAIEKARAKGWDVIHVRATRGVPRNKEARTVRRVFCPGCAWLVGVTFR